MCNISLLDGLTQFDKRPMVMQWKGPVGDSVQEGTSGLHGGREREEGGIQGYWVITKGCQPDQHTEPNCQATERDDMEQVQLRSVKEKLDMYPCFPVQVVNVCLESDRRNSYSLVCSAQHPE